MKDGTTYRILSDQVGSVRLVVNATTGAVVQRIDYDAFGVVTQDTHPGFQPFGFAGGLTDQDTGLVRFGARDYDPRVGRWTSKDPLGLSGGMNDLTGASRVPPRWSFGFWQSRISYRSADEALEVVRRNREAEIPTDVIHLDTHWFRQDWRCDLEFDPERFPDPAGFVKQLDGLGVKLCLWQLP